MAWLGKARQAWSGEAGWGRQLIAGMSRAVLQINLIRTFPYATPHERHFPFREATLPGLPTWASLALASDSPGQSGISGGLTDSGAHDRINLSRWLPGEHPDPSPRPPSGAQKEISGSRVGWAGSRPP